jgi:hypothetical protein
MEKTKPKFQPWTKEEMALLADLMGKAFNAGNNQTEAATFAASKLGRTPSACLGMYHLKMRKKPLSMWALEPTIVEERTVQADYIAKEKHEVQVTLYDEVNVPHKGMILSQTETKIVVKFGIAVIVIDL